MAGAIVSCDALNRDIALLPSRVLVFKGGQCGVCLRALNGDAYVYACGHGVHASCVLAEQECCVCGDAVVEGIDEPFVSGDEGDAWVI